MGIVDRGVSEIITVEVPLSTIFGYANELRSLTQGRASFCMRFARYAEVPNDKLVRHDEVAAP